MDHTILHPFVAELRATERLKGFAEAFPKPARVSEPALPLLLASLHEELDRPLVLLAPEDQDARDAAEGAAWFLGDERVAMLPSRGVHWGSGLDPAPHLVGERARALDVLAAGGLVAASAAVAEPMPPPNARPQPIRIAPGEGISLEQLSETLALAGYERVERADERGQFAVRGGLVDVFPTTGREPLRIEFWGDEIEQMRAFSPFTQRALHPVEAAVIYPAVERRLDLVEPTLVDDGKAIPVPTDLVRPVPRGPDLVWQADEVRMVWEEEGLEPVPFGKAALLDTLPAGQPFAFEAQRPALVARGLAEAENELAAFVRSGQRVVVAFPHLGEALRQKNLLRRIEARVVAEREALPREAGLMFAVTPARRGFVWRDLGLVLLPGADSTAGRSRRCRPTGVSGGSAGVPCSRSRTSAAAISSSTRTTASGSCSASRPKRWQASRATTSSSASGATTGCTSRTSSSARCRATSARTALRPRSRSSAARRGTTSRTVRGSRCVSSPGSCLRCTRSGSRRRAWPTICVTNTWSG